MFESKYSKLLTVLLVIVLLAILGLLGFLGYNYYKNHETTEEASGFVENFKTEIGEESSNSNTGSNNNSNNNELEDQFIEGLEGLESTTSKDKDKIEKLDVYKWFGVLGIIEIPEIDLEYPILEKVTKTSLETSVAFQYGVGLNEVGNNVIIGHNYRNGVFFSNNHKLEIGDKIHITNHKKEEIKYEIYEMFYADPSDASFYQRDTNGIPEITLSTCSDDSSTRLIILAKAMN